MSHIHSKLHHYFRMVAPVYFDCMFTAERHRLSRHGPVSFVHDEANYYERGFNTGDQLSARKQISIFESVQL